MIVVKNNQIKNHLFFIFSPLFSLSFISNISFHISKALRLDNISTSVIFWLSKKIVKSKMADQGWSIQDGGCDDVI